MEKEAQGAEDIVAGKCPHCGRPVQFIETAGGKRLSWELNRVALIEPSTRRVFTGFVSHFFVCPKASESRRG